MKYYLIAGEKSGDLHGANLLREILENDPDAEFRFLGGDQMSAVGGTLYRHYREISYMLVGDVIRNIGTIYKNYKLCAKDIEAFAPDVLILIDFSAFNLPVAKKVRHLGFPIHYYISPKIWAWNTSRAHKIKKLVDRMFVIMPFEKAFYQTFDYSVDYVGNPILDEISRFVPAPDFRSLYSLGNRKIIALLPGSRKQEVAHMLDMMVKMREEFAEYEFVVAGVDNLPRSMYTPYEDKGMKVIFGDTYNLLTHSHAALVTSGTATLETALFNVPQVVCYKTGAFTYLIGRALIKIKFISLVNLIVGRQVVKELIQANLNMENLKMELSKILDGDERAFVLKGYEELKQIMGEVGASKKTAGLIQSYLNKKRA